MREVGPEVSGSIVIIGLRRAVPAQKPPRAVASSPSGLTPWAASGGRCAKHASRSEINLSYILDLALGCRCQGVGNWELPGGVMLSTHPPAGLTTDLFCHAATAPASTKTKCDLSV